MKSTYYRIATFITIIMLVLGTHTNGQASGSSDQNLTPISYTTTSGSTGGQPVNALAVKDQSGKDNNANAYVLFTTPGVAYEGIQVFTLPTNSQKTALNTMLLNINFMNTGASGQRWSWSIYNWANQDWTLLGTSDKATAKGWNMLVFAAASPDQFVDASGEIRVRLRSSDTSGDAKIDYEAIYLTYQSAATATSLPPTPTATSVPPTPTPTATSLPPTPTFTPVPTQGQSGNTYYVSANGNDANPGTQSQPWGTIQKAANSMVAGDIVVVQAGNYAAQRVHVMRSGSSGAAITYQASGVVTMKGFNVQANYIAIRGFEIANTDYVRWNPSTSAGIYLRGSDNVIETNYIHDSALVGIYIYGTPGEPTVSSNNIIRNNQLYHNEKAGIEVNGRNNLIEGNEVWGTVQCHPTLTAVEDNAADNPNHLTCPYYPGVGGLDADGMRFFGQGHIFRKNSIHGISLSDPLNINPHIDCFQTWRGTSWEVAQNIIFEQNYCENLNEGMYAFMISGGANNITIRNNIINTFGGVDIHSDGQHHLYIYNNLWINDLSFRESTEYPGAIILKDAPYSIVKNNIFYNQPGYTIIAIGDTTGQSIDYNLAFNSDGSNADCMRVGNYVCVNPSPAHDKWNIDPRFTNPGAFDYHPQANSPVIDAGVALSVTNDYNGNPRPQGSGYDIGIYEAIAE